MIKSHAAPFRLEDFKDDYEDALRQLIKARRAETPLPVAEEKPRARVIGLMDALKHSVDQSKKKPATAQRSAQKGPTLVKSGKRSHRAA